MKFRVNNLIAFALVVFMTFVSCENEVTDVTLPNAQETILPSSDLALLMSMASANSGSYDDILDSSSCFSIELPVTIVVSDVVIIVESIEDLEALEDLFEEFQDEEDFLDFVFPITLIFSDYTEMVIANEDELENFISDCEADDDFDDVIECIDFVYPISFSIFNQVFDVIDTVLIENDQALYNFLEELEDEDNTLIVSLNYPITMVYASGETIEVNSNQELVEVINSVGDDCDDNDSEECNEQGLAANLTECLWEIDDPLNDFDDFYLDFNDDGSLQVIVGATTQFIEGNWELTSSEDGLAIIISELTAYQEDLGGTWVIVDCNDHEIQIVKGDLTFELYQECEEISTCNAIDMAEDLLLCYWEIQTYTSFPEFVGFEFEFFDNGTFSIGLNGEVYNVTSFWTVQVEGGVTILNLDSDFEDIGGQWVLVECELDKYTFQKGQDFMIIDKDCNEDNAFECFESFEAELEICDNGTDGPNTFDLSLVFANCQADEINYHTALSDAENASNPIANPSSYTTPGVQSVVYARVEINSEFMIFDISLSVVDCGASENCPAEAVMDYLQTCTWTPVSFNGDDNLAGFTLLFGQQELIIEGNGVAITTTYFVEGNTPVFMFINGLGNTAASDLSGDWTVLECSSDRLELQRNNDLLVLEQSCD